jgi:hypothetical protein
VQFQVVQCFLVVKRPWCNHISAVVWLSKSLWHSNNQRACSADFVGKFVQRTGCIALEKCGAPVTNHTFRIGWPICIGPTFCLAALACMSTGNSQVCYVSHDHICIAYGQVWPRKPSPHFLPASLTICAHFALLCSPSLGQGRGGSRHGRCRGCRR